MMLSEQKLAPFMLPPGTQVGPGRSRRTKGAGPTACCSGPCSRGSPRSAPQPLTAARPSRPVPETPLKDQRRAPRCLPPVEIIIHGGCWVELPSMKPPCKAPLHEWQGGCYMPSLNRPRQPTSEPAAGANLYDNQTTRGRSRPVPPLSGGLAGMDAC
jgi:hypothetical protein